MYQLDASVASRRAVLKAAGAVGLTSLVGSGSVVATTSRRPKRGFGNGNGIGAFLNEKAEYKASPIWSSGVVNATDQSGVEVVVGATTSTTHPEGDQLPVAFAPRAVKVSPGTTVTWTWPNTVPPIPHNVVSLEEGLFDSGVRPPGGPDFEYTFDDSGTYLYYCTPHGAPFPVHPHGQPPEARVYNEFGMRGAVLVAGD